MNSVYVQTNESERIACSPPRWEVGDGGSLSPIGSWEGVPATVAGLAAS